MKEFYLIFMIAIIAIIAILTYYFSKKQRVLRELKKSEAIPISRAKQGDYVKIIGKAVGGNQLLKAPLSGRPCLYYYVLVEKKGDKSWHTYVEEEDGQDFFLETGFERAIVKPKGTHFGYRRTLFVFDHKDKSGSFNDAKPHLEQFLKRHGKESVNFIGFNKTLRYSEGVIEEGETIAVKGIAQWKTLNEPIEGYTYSKLLTFIGDEKNKLIITDLPEAVKKEKKI